MTGNKHKIPLWAKKLRKPKTEIKRFKDNYYLYEVSSFWDSQLKKTRKKSGKLIGYLDKEKGFIPKLERVSIDSSSRISTKEYGVSGLIDNLFSEHVKELKESFPDNWEQILVFAYARLLHQSPIKNVSLHYEHSYLSESFKNISIGEKSLSNMLYSVGSEREKIVSFFKKFGKNSEYILVDGTSFSSKADMPLVERGYDSSKQFRPQAKLLFAYSQNNHIPAYYRLTPGNINDVKSFKIAIAESGLSNITVVADKGFYSNSNIEELKCVNLKFIVPLPRNSSLIDYSKFQTINKKLLGGYFTFNGKVIWYSQKGEVITYLNEQLKIQEQSDYLSRIETHPEEYSIEGFHGKEHTFGTISLISNLVNSSPEELYVRYKSRADIEQLFDTFKNLLEGDRSYMQNEKSLEGWMFINYIALCWYYKIYSLLVNHKLINKVSVNDILQRLSKINKVRINSSWVLSEITAKTNSLIKTLGVTVT